jgi:hypothetical protein
MGINEVEDRPCPSAPVSARSRRSPNTLDAGDVQRGDGGINVVRIALNNDSSATGDRDEIRMRDAPSPAIAQTNIEGCKRRGVEKIANHGNRIHGSNLNN